MKRNVVLMLLALLPLCGCKKNYDDTLPLKKSDVKAEYKPTEFDESKNMYKSAEFDLTCDQDVDFKNAKFVSLQDKKTEVKDVLVGDILNIYYRDDTYTKIDHIYVEEVKIKECMYCYIPEYPMETTCINIKSDDRKINIDLPFSDPRIYAINEDKSCTNILYSGQCAKVYATYVESDDRDNIKALYTYLPR